MLNFEDYVKACYDHLTAKTSSGQSYYSIVNVLEVEKTKTKITETIKEAYEENIISKSEFEAMKPDDKVVGRFYCNFKVHKAHKNNELPPERPIVSQSGSICENIAAFVEHHIHHIGNKHKSFIQDTPDFLRTIERINNGQQLKPNSVLFTMDAKGLFTNIMHEEGLKTMHDALSKRTNPKVPKKCLVKLMKCFTLQQYF